ncbi:hypothetical protein [uncultured Hymenobacter sp.]
MLGVDFAAQPVQHVVHAAEHRQLLPVQILRVVLETRQQQLVY